MVMLTLMMLMMLMLWSAYSRFPLKLTGKIRQTAMICRLVPIDVCVEALEAHNLKNKICVEALSSRRKDAEVAPKCL